MPAKKPVDFYSAPQVPSGGKGQRPVCTPLFLLTTYYSKSSTDLRGKNISYPELIRKVFSFCGQRN